MRQRIGWSDLQHPTFAMWQPCDADTTFVTSPIQQKWNTVFTLTKHSWSFIAADLLKALNVLDPKRFRLQLPENSEAFAFATPEGEQIVLSLSRTRGIQFHFADTTPFEYRCAFLDHFIPYCQAWETLIAQSGGNPDEDSGFEAWWHFTCETSVMLEKTEPLTVVGQIVPPSTSDASA